jgi:tetratricopeptide (TPR) repeat protein
MKTKKRKFFARGMGAAMAMAALVLALCAVRPAAAQAAEASGLRAQWAEIKYREPDRKAQIEKFDELAQKAEALSKAEPQNAAAKVWAGTSLSSEAAAIDGITALPKLKRAKALLEAAIAQDDKAEGGFAHAVLGALYDRVPGWPIAFGDGDKARAHLKRALEIDPAGIDANFYYGDYLVHQKKYAEAMPVLEKALAAKDRPGMKTADEGRRAEIRSALQKARAGAQKAPEKSGYN